MATKDEADFNRHTEIWKPIKGFEGCYEVSNLGRVKSVRRYVNGPRGGKRIVEEKILTAVLDKYGYLHVCLVNRKRKKTPTIHRLVAEAFLPNRDRLPCVNHKNEDKGDNNVSNLEWCSVRYNNTYGSRLSSVSRTQLRNNKRGMPVALLNTDGSIIKSYQSMSRAAIDLNVSVRHICDNCHDNRRSVQGFRFKLL